MPKEKKKKKEASLDRKGEENKRDTSASFEPVFRSGSFFGPNCRIVYAKAQLPKWHV